MQHNTASNNQKVWLIFLLAAVLLFFRLGSSPIYILDEAKNAQCAREMWYNGNPIVPTFNGQLRTDKPPLHYWFMGMAYQVVGAHAASARFFSGIMGLFTLLIGFMMVKKYAGESIALYSLLTLVLSPHFLFEFRLSVPDPYLIAFTTAGLWSGFVYLHEQKRIGLFGAGFFLGLAILAKGPVALVLPALVFILFMLFTKKWHAFKDPFVLLAILLAISIAFPWYWTVHQKTEGAFTRGFFIEHNLNRFSSEKEGHGAPFFVTALVVLLGLLPFSLFILHAIPRKNGFWKHPIFLFSAIVTGVYVVFFSISNTKLPNYAMPCYPFAAVMAGFAIQKIVAAKQRIPPYIQWTWLVLAFLIPSAVFVALQMEPAVKHLGWVSLLLCILPVGSVIHFILSKKMEGAFLMRYLVGVWLSFAGIFLVVCYPLIYNENPVTKLLPIVNQTSGVVAYKMYNPAFNFNLQKPKDKIPVYETIDSLQAALNLNSGLAGRDYYIVSRKDFSEELARNGFEKIAEAKDLFELPVTVIYKKKE